MNKESNVLALHFLCVGVDSNFLAYLLTSAQSIQVTLDSCRSSQEAKERTKNYFYDVYIIDFSHSEIEALKLIEEIRDKGEKKTFIAITVDAEKEKKISDQFRGTNLIDCILQKPIFPQKIDQFLQDLTEFYSKNLTNPDSVNLQILKQDYDRSIFSKLENLNQLIDQVKKRQTSEALSELKGVVQKLGGSAGTYGYLPVGQLCKELVGEIDEKINSDQPLDPVWANSLDLFYQKIKKSFQATFSSDTEATLLQNSQKKPLIYIIDEDQSFTDLLERVKEQFKLDLHIENDSEKGYHLLSQKEFTPDYVAFSQKVQNTDFDVFNLIESVKARNLKKQTLFALLLDQDNISTRVKAMEKGVDYIFRKPISAFILLKSITDALQSQNLSHIRVLILDDDEDLCRFVVAILMEIGITVKAIYESKELFKALEEFQPTILLLDLILPEYDGMDLLRSIRQDVVYRDLIIVIITSNEETATRLNAYAARADDILYKPLDRNVLQKRILNLVERRNSLSLFSNDDNDFMGLPGLKDLMNDLHSVLMAKPNQKFLVLFEVKNFKDWTLQNGEAKAKDLLISLSNDLQGVAERSMKCYFYNLTTFALIFEGVYITNIEPKVYTFLSQFLQNQAGDGLSFDISIVPIHKKIGNAQEILEKAEHGLKVASEGSSSINLINLAEGAQTLDKKEVVIVDEDSDLLRILKQAFEAHGLSVKTFVEGKDALNSICEKGKDALPSLMIVERKLPDMDGMDLYQKIKNYFHQDIPFYVLTVFSSDKDISDGIKKGIREYIIKPFNISILVHKVLKEIAKNS